MGYIVDGYCHSTLTEAELHLRDLAASGQGHFFDSAGEAVVYETPGTTPQAGQATLRFEDYNMNTDTPVPLPACDSSFHDGPMPWTEAGDAFWVELSPEVVGELVVGAFMLWGLAWILRSLRRFFK